MGTVIVIASGKGGTGKTTCTGALSTALSMQGHRTVCLDCDVGLKNLDLTLGLTDTALWDFSDVMEGRVPLDEALCRHPQAENLWFLPAPSHLTVDDVNEEEFLSLIGTLRDKFDYCLIDAPAGLGRGFKLASAGADIAIVISTADASSLRDGQRTVAELRSGGVEDVRLIVNRVRPGAFRRMKATVDDIIDAVGAQLIGLVSEDDSVSLAANLETPLMIFGAKYAYDQFLRIARRIVGERVPLGKVRGQNTI